jgi:hypothetical protein
MTPRRIVVEIDELVLHGFDPHERYRIGDALQAELSTLLAGSGLDAAPRPAIERVDAGGFAMAAGDDGAAIGRGAAQALHRSIK